MKNLLLTLLLGLLCGSLSAQSLLDKNVDLNYKDTPLLQVINDLQDRYEIPFSYGNVDLSGKISLNYKGNLTNALNQLFENQAIIYIELNGRIILKSSSPKTGDQNTQTIRGRVLDQDSKTPLIGANIIILGSDPLIGTTTDLDGYFKLEKTPLGRCDIRISYLGYEEKVIPQILVSIGKEVVLNTEMQEHLSEFKEVVIQARQDKSQPLNDMATVSARSFSVEETQRYAAAISDPARMAQSYAGVSSGGDDLSNEIIIRGNSAKGLLWRLEGIEIPNPNHYGSLGAGGGSVSMLSSNMLSTSDFYTGAFPAEFGNALSGVFDLRFRNGNSEKRENSIMVGLMGLELSTEGYFKKGSRASYLVNYRYSTLGLINKLLPTIEQDGVNYQDLSFKINIPTDGKGTFSIFGLGGINSDEDVAIRDTSMWVVGGDNIDYLEYQKMGVYGLAHKYSINEKTFIRTTLSGSAEHSGDKTESLDPLSDYVGTVIDESKFENYSFNANVILNHKFSASHTLRSGIDISHKTFGYEYSTFVEDTPASGEWQKFLDNSGNSQLLQAFSQWKYRISDSWTFNGGFHFTYLTLNNTFAFDPRMAIQYKLNNNQSLGLAAGLHSKPEHLSTYFIERISDDGVVDMPNKELKMQSALHLVASYDLSFAKDFRLKLEAYYQYLYNIPISTNPESTYSILNTADIWDVIFQNDMWGSELESKGTGRNYGIDITLEKFFSRQYYFLVTSSLFDSKFTAPNGNEYPTRYANNFILNLVGGKEFKVGKEKDNIIGLNGKFTFYNGNRDTPILLEESLEAGHMVEDLELMYSDHAEPYYRFDVGISYKLNASRATHSFSLDVQNVTNRYNIYTRYYDSETENIELHTQNGAIPILGYKVQF